MTDWKTNPPFLSLGILLAVIVALALILKYVWKDEWDSLPWKPAISIPGELEWLSQSPNLPQLHTTTHASLYMGCAFGCGQC